jgi:hypothetical protein
MPLQRGKKPWRQDTFRNNSSQSIYPYSTNLKRIISIPDYANFVCGIVLSDSA